MKIKAQDVIDGLAWLSSFGSTEQGGITRLLYSKEWLDAQYSLKKRMESSGMQAQFDNIGNLYGRVLGSRFPDETIASGSHIDTVVNGGQLDGQFGVLAAFLAIDYLMKQHGQPLRTLEVISVAEEEGSRFPYAFWGSKNIFGIMNNAEAEVISDVHGVKFIDAMRSCGFDFHDESLPERKDIKAFVELHIEQGAVLEQQQQQIGVVTAIVGQQRYTIRLTGESNHAGTTPMSYRKDTIVAFSRICYEATKKANEKGDPLVLTFGRVEPKPNVVNVVPGETVFSIDCRHTDRQLLLDFLAEIKRDMQRIADEMHIGIEFDLWMDEDPVPMDPHLTQVIERICQQEQINYRMMHSGAGHDSQIFAQHVPTAMIFIPSIKGISHNPKESTKLEDLVAGVNVLAKTLYELAYKE